MAKTSRPDSKVTPQIVTASKKKGAMTKTKSSKRGKKKALGGKQEYVGARDLKEEDFTAYLRLRQALDSFGLKALYYYASGENAQQSTERAEEVKKYLRAFMPQESSYDDTGTDCPPGTRACAGGDCVPISIGCFIGDDGG